MNFFKISPLLTINFSLFLIMIIFCHEAIGLPKRRTPTLREFLAEKQQPQNRKLLKAKLTREDTILDHLEIQSARQHSFDPFNPDREPDFILPKQNSRVITTYLLDQLEKDNKTSYDILKEQLTQVINNRTLTNKENKDMELDLLNTNNIVVSCKWFVPVPYPFDDDQCSKEEMNEIKNRLGLNNRVGLSEARQFVNETS